MNDAVADCEFEPVIVGDVVCDTEFDCERETVAEVVDVPEGVFDSETVDVTVGLTVTENDRVLVAVVLRDIVPVDDDDEHGDAEL